MAGGHDNERRNRSESDYNFPCMLSTQKNRLLRFFGRVLKRSTGQLEMCILLATKQRSLSEGPSLLSYYMDPGGGGRRRPIFPFLGLFRLKKNFLKIDARRHCWAEAAEAPEPEKGRERNAFRSCRLACLTYFGSLSCPWNA